jgi:hypothetical protein
MQVVFILKLFHFYFLLFSGTLHGMYSMVNWGRKSLRSQPKLVLNNISLYTTVNTSQFSLCSFIYPYDSNHKHLKSHHNDNREAELLLSDRTHLRHLSTFFRWLCIEFLKSVHFPRVMFWKIVVLVFFFCSKTVHFRFYSCAILYQTSCNTVSYIFDKANPQGYFKLFERVCWWHGDNFFVELLGVSFRGNKVLLSKNLFCWIFRDELL